MIFFQNGTILQSQSSDTNFPYDANALKGPQCTSAQRKQLRLLQLNFQSFRKFFQFARIARSRRTPLILEARQSLSSPQSRRRNIPLSGELLLYPEDAETRGPFLC